ELTGNSIDTLEGSLYLLLPPNDYSEFSSGSYAGVELEGLEGSVELWVDIAQGRMDALRGTADVGSLALRGTVETISADPGTNDASVSDLASRFFLRRQQG